MNARLQDWRSRLAAWLATIAREPFAYGSHDCALFAAGAIEALTGEDAAQDWRGKYSTLQGGLKLLRRSGYADHLHLAKARFPLTQNPRAGDLALVPVPDGVALGVVQGALVYVPANVGWGLVPREAAIEFLEV